MSRLWHVGSIIILLAAFAFGLWRLDAESVWHDEAWSIRAIRSPFGTPDDNTPPLYYLTLHTLQLGGAGESPFALRYGSVLIFLLVVAAGLRLAGRWSGAWAGGLAGVLLASSPLLWEYAQEVRAYIAIPLIAIGLLLATDALLQARSSLPRRMWLAVLVIELAGLYTHNLAVPLVVWLNGVVAIVWITRRAWRLWGLWLASQVILFILYLPWMMTQSPSGTSLNTVPRFDRQLSQDIWRGYVFPVIADPDQLPDSFIRWVHLFPLLFGIATVYILWRGRSLRAFLLLSQAIGLPILSTLLLIRASIDFHPRYYILALPATLLTLAYAAGLLPRVPRFVAIGLVAVGLSAVGWQSLTLITQNKQYQHDDFRGLAEYYATLPADTLILIPYGYEPTLQHYYVEKLNIRAKLAPLPLYASPEDTLIALNTALADYRQVEALTWFQVPADERGMLGCFLGSIGQPTASYTTYGLTTQRYEGLGGEIGAIPIEADGRFESPLVLNDLQAYIGQSGVCLQSDWQLETQSPTEEFKVAARLLDPFGDVLAAADSLITRDNQARLPDWERGDHGAAFTLVDYPEGLPAGDYALTLRLYTSTQPSGFDVLNPTGQSLGKDFRLSATLPANPFATLPEESTILSDNGPLYSGGLLEVTILNAGAETTLTLAGEDWTLSESIPSGPALAWASFTLPPDAAGEAILSLDDAELSRYPITKIERLYTAPNTAIPLGVSLGGVAELVGANVTHTDSHLQVELIWRALATPESDYTVFVQLLDANGRLLVTEDDIPADGGRPTRSWLAGEYILDSHPLDLAGVARTEGGRLIIGLYNPISGERLKTPSGADFVPLEIEDILR